MRRVLRWLNLVAGVVCLASGASALSSWIADPGYRAHYRDPLWLLAAYVAFYAWVLRAFWRDDAWAPRLAVVKALGAYAFLVSFVMVGHVWMARTPGRYVYQLFEWGPDNAVVLMAYVFFGRGIWNTLNAMIFTAPWWMRLRRERPFVGRVVTMIPIAIMVTMVFAYRELVRLDRATFSAEAIAAAKEIADGIDCEAIQSATAPVTTDVRQRGERRYDVQIKWDCRDLQVLVRDPDGRVGSIRTPRLECCPDARAP